MMIAARSPAANPDCCSHIASGKARALNSLKGSRSFSGPRSDSYRHTSRGHVSSASLSASPSDEYFVRSSMQKFTIATETQRSQSKTMLKNKALNSLGQKAGIKVNQKAHFLAGVLEICKHLSFKKMFDSFNTLQFHYHKIFYNQIQPV